MSTYRIIDEPKVKIDQQLIVNPVVILFAAMLVPLFVTIPFHGKFWLPFIWLIMNAYFLGSPTFWREFCYSLIGLFAIAGVFIGFGYGIKTEVITSPNKLAPYMRVLVNAIYFIALYLVVFTQSVPFSVYEYVKQQGRHE
ncbi:hypothetical protein GCM10011613_30290 [Cellvibrio zantedeschiae]|uniref:Uncharacterized protein n=1 Tax=Cellvibrio zantedeschiae TaxID=1237077 RepID=A0ABQ3B7Z0_9GAMM|nr:hypothetical protein [Cellvibrio zantedeschiae]GGY83344.1 hypothetical protein GCM10011613_30290 [Cellvibrio zantedeschiae]